MLFRSRFYSIQPGLMKGSKRLVVLLPADALGRPEFEPLEEFATLVSADGAAAAVEVSSEPAT